MKNGSEVGVSGVTFELLRFPGSSVIDEHLMIYNQILSDYKVPEQ